MKRFRMKQGLALVLSVVIVMGTFHTHAWAAELITEKDSFVDDTMEKPEENGAENEETLFLKITDDSFKADEDNAEPFEEQIAEIAKDEYSLEDLTDDTSEDGIEADPENDEGRTAVVDEEIQAIEATEQQEIDAQEMESREIVDAQGETSPKVKNTVGNEIIEEETEAAEENKAVMEGETSDSGKCGDNAMWTLTGSNDNLTLTISGNGKMNDYMNYYIVSPWYSERSKIKTVIIESGITYIGQYAFYHLNMINSVTIADSVKSIGSYAFSDCDSLTSIIIPNGVTSIEIDTFKNCRNLTDVTIPDSVTSIEMEAFLSCSGLERITIPGSVKSIGEMAFDSCSRLTSITIPTGVERIEDCAFSNCTSLNSVEIPSSIENMGDGAFEGCSSLTNVTISDGAKMIGAGAFDGCNLKSIIIPDSVTYIGNFPFGYDNSVIVVYFKGTKAQWDEAVGMMAYFFVSKKAILYNFDFNEKIEYEMSLTSSIYTGKGIYPTVTLSCNGKTLIQDIDYTLSYKNNINPGDAIIDITGKGDYSGTASLAFSILPGKTTRGDMFNLANNVKVTWKAVPGAKFYRVYREGITDSDETISNPVIQTSGLVGWDKAPGLTNGHAYRYRIVASCSDSYWDDSGDSPLSYSKVMYRLKTVVIRSVKNTAPGKVTVKYDKTTSGDSYVLQYSENEDMTGAKTKVVLGANNTSYVIGGLKKGKTYYISIRVRKKVNGIDYYTTFGVPKKIKITQ